jgi:uncharacterized repeat protein (TIGR03803 family)
MGWTNSLQPIVAYPIRALWPLVALMAVGLMTASAARTARAQTPTTIYRFCLSHDAACPNGNNPNALIQATDGNLYGTTLQGGIGGSGCDGFSDVGCGTAFKITPSGSLTTLHRFCLTKTCPDGIYPSSLVQATNGDLYGMTMEGGLNGNVACPSSIVYTGCGTVFKITPGGELTTIYRFCSQPNCADGSVPLAGLIQATNGDLYGTTPLGGRGGTLFTLSPDGQLTTLYSFSSRSGSDSGDPVTPLLQATSGSLYGTTAGGAIGSSSDGTVFSLNLGLGPFVALQTISGQVGERVTILGTDLTDASSVTFNGTPATFTVNSTGSAIIATVPAGATSGAVEVTTPNGTLQSNKRFRIA